LIGRKFNEKEVQNDIKHFPFTVVSKNGQPRVKVDVHNEETTFTPEEISAMVLGKVSTLVRIARRHH
jgi:heat shock protein 5